MEVTNGHIDSAHYGPTGDAARHIASYCQGNARAHVYTAAFDALTTTHAETAALRAEVERLREATRYIMPYLRWTIGKESPGHHPTMPSAVAAFESAFACDCPDDYCLPDAITNGGVCRVQALKVQP